jgi:hypothetical protein
MWGAERIEKSTRNSKFNLHVYWLYTLCWIWSLQLSKIIQEQLYDAAILTLYSLNVTWKQTRNTQLWPRFFNKLIKQVGHNWSHNNNVYQFKHSISQPQGCYFRAEIQDRTFPLDVSLEKKMRVYIWKKKAFKRNRINVIFYTWHHLSDNILKPNAISLNNAYNVQIKLMITTYRHIYTQNRQWNVNTCLSYWHILTGFTILETWFVYMYDGFESF